MKSCNYLCVIDINILIPVLTWGHGLLSAEHYWLFYSLLSNTFIQHTGEKKIFKQKTCWTKRPIMINFFTHLINYLRVVFNLMLFFCFVLFWNYLSLTWFNFVIKQDHLSSQNVHSFHGEMKSVAIDISSEGTGLWEIFFPNQLL